MIQIMQCIVRGIRYVRLWIIYLRRQVDFANGGGIPKLMRFQEHFKEY